MLLFDGICGLCNGTVRVLLRLDRRRVLRFAPLEGATAAALLARHPETRDVDSLVLVEDLGGEGERVRVKSDAVLALIGHLGGVWRALKIFGLLPTAVRDWTYDLVARHRYALFGRLDRPRPPAADTAARFLE